MCLCEEVLDRNVGKALLFQVNLCEGLTRLRLGQWNLPLIWRGLVEGLFSSV